MTTLSGADRLRGLRVLVGNTPLLAVEFSVNGGQPRRRYAKAESLNLTGSIKDRMALRLDELDRILAVDDGDALLMAKKLAGELGLAVGLSSGANVLAADEPVLPGHRSPHVQFLGFRAVNRVCDVCFDPADSASAPAGFFSIARKA